MIKRLLASGLILLFLFNIFGYYFIYQYNRFLIRLEVKARIRSGTMNEQAEILVLSNPLPSHDFRWINRKEFRYRGRLYDVISIKRNGDSTLIHCINDKNEESLIARYSTFLGTRSWDDLAGRAKNARIMLDHLIKHALLKETISREVPFIILKEPITGAASLQCRVCPPPSPPPELSC